MERRVDVIRIHRTKGSFRYGLEPDSVKAQNSSRCGKPKISVRGLLDVKYGGDALLRRPFRVMEVRDLRGSTRGKNLEEKECTGHPPKLAASRPSHPMSRLAAGHTASTQI